MKSFRNASITSKSLIVTIVGGIVLIGTVVLVAASFLSIQQADQAQTVALDLQGNVHTSWLELARGQAALYQAINLKSQNVDLKLVRKAKDTATQSVSHATSSLRGAQVKDLRIDPALLDHARKALDAYAGAAKQAASFADVDAFNATMFMTDAEQKFDLAQQAMSALDDATTRLEFELDVRMADLLHGRFLTILICFGCAVLFSVAASTWLGRLIARPIIAMTGIMRRLAEGDLSVEPPAIGQTDEVGEMAKAVLVFRENAQLAHSLQEEADRERLVKDRRQAATDRCIADFGASIVGVMAGLTRSAESMHSTASAMAEAAEHVRADAARTAEGATTSAHNLSAVAAAAEQMSASINEIGQQVGRVSQAVHEAVERATATDARVSEMAAAADRVNDVVGLINSIASQTNLLALNATIEAARAGEAGKGFAVVAGEVKALAAQTAKATGDIGSQITAIHTATGQAVDAVRSVTEAISQVEQVASAIAAAVEQQATVTREIVVSVQTVTEATHEATRAMQLVSAAAESADSASRTVLTGAAEVGGNAATLRTEVDEFLAAMARTDEAERRLYQRASGNGSSLVLRRPGAADIQCQVQDISRGGVGLRGDLKLEPGSELQVVLPGTNAAVAARVVRAGGGVIALAFRQERAMLTRIDAALAHIAMQGSRQAA